MACIATLNTAGDKQTASVRKFKLVSQKTPMYNSSHFVLAVIDGCVFGRFVGLLLTYTFHHNIIYILCQCKRLSGFQTFCKLIIVPFKHERKKPENSSFKKTIICLCANLCWRILAHLCALGFISQLHSKLSAPFRKERSGICPTYLHLFLKK